MNIRTAFERPRVYWTALVFVAYMTLLVVTSQFYSTIQYVVYYADQVRWIELGISILFSLIIGALVSINSVLGYLQYKHRRQIKQSAISCAAGIGGLATGVCPFCISGLFPLIMNWAGLTFSWGLLPFQGLEVQAFLIMILGASLYVTLHKGAQQ